MAKLISFDIDGTLEAGDPPGSVTMDVVRGYQVLGYLVGSCSDRPISQQRRIWEEHRIHADFTVLKHRLGDLRSRFRADAYYHVGDGEMDRFFAERAGFKYLMPGDIASGSWSPDGSP